MTNIKIIQPDGIEIILENAMQTLSLLTSQKPRCTVNGTIAKDLPIPMKYQSVITGAGRAPHIPASQSLKIYCQQYIWQQGNGTSLILIRPAAEKSILAMDANNMRIDVDIKEDKLLSSRDNIDIVRFRPILDMHVLQMENTQDSWTEEPTWSLSLIED